METELELCNAFKRYPRKYHEDPCTYPWLPEPVPKVCFALKFKY